MLMLTPHTKTLTLELDWNICNIPYQVLNQTLRVGAYLISI